jgi:MerR family transcriptional regulator, mercuric resistance operon regulatory protein
VSTTLTVKQVATRAGVSPDTVRYYERLGLLPAPRRTSGDHRRFDEPVLDRLGFIRSAQRLGLSLTEIRHLLEIRDTGECPCEPAGDLLRRHIEAVDVEIARLLALRSDMAGMLTDEQACADMWCGPGGRR